jgi:hypothetical protein
VRLAGANGFSLHAGVSCEGYQKDKRESAFAGTSLVLPSLSISSTGKVLYTRKTPYRDGTTLVAFVPIGFIAQSVALGQTL